MKKCGTPIQRELFDFILEQFVESVKQFCNDGDNKEGKSPERALSLNLYFIAFSIQACDWNQSVSLINQPFPFLTSTSKSLPSHLPTFFPPSSPLILNHTPH